MRGKITVVLWLLICLSLVSLPSQAVADSEADWCRLGWYQFNDKRAFMQTADDGDFTSIKWRLGLEDELNIRVRADWIEKARLARVRLIDQDGRLYAKSSLEKVKVEDTYYYQAKFRLVKNFDWLVVETEIIPAGRQRRTKKEPFFFQALVVRDDFNTDLQRSDWCLTLGQKAKINVIDQLPRGQIGQLRAWLVNRRKQNLPIKVTQAVFSGETDVLAQVEIDLSDLKLEDDWYSLTLTSNGGKKPVLVMSLPVYITSRPIKWQVLSPSQGDSIGDKVEISGWVETSLPAEVVGWYTAQTDENTDWVYIGRQKFQPPVYEGRFFEWVTQDLIDGVYKLKLEFHNWAGSGGESFISGLVKKTKPERFGLKVSPFFNLPDIIVSTMTQQVQGRFGGDDAGLVIVDQRLVQPGWTVTARFKPLYSPTADNFISPVNLLTVIPESLRPLEGELDGIKAGHQVVINSPDQAVLISQAQPGFGGGVYQQSLILKWLIPANTPAGDYQGEVIFTIQ